MVRPIYLFTDFGLSGFYVGQLHGAILDAQTSPGPVIDLMHDAQAHDVQSAAYLLAALIRHTPDNAVIVGVVDPGVGSDRPAIVVEADGRCLIGPGNGLFEIVARQAGNAVMHRLVWQPDRLTASFHGRDLFAPAAARIATTVDSDAWRLELISPLPPSAARPGSDWPDDLPAVIYIDVFGNAMTGIRAAKLAPGLAVAIGGRRIQRATTFSDVPTGEAFWYENSVGLVEIAVNQGRASETLALSVGSSIGLI
ncbi:MAG: SAM-dependent chlorinase/fluorinase [Alphaproteobacteria bacterium]